MQDRIIKLSEMNFEKLNVITLTESGGLMGEIVVIKNIVRWRVFPRKILW